jgi:predicted Zn-dependent protease with MMP-like domain
MMLTDKFAQDAFNNASDEVREMVERMVLVIENENPANVTADKAIAIAVKWEAWRFDEMLREAKAIIKMDVGNIRKAD